MLYWFLPYVSVNQQGIHMFPAQVRLPPSPSHPTPPGCPGTSDLDSLCYAAHGLAGLSVRQWTKTNGVFSSPDSPLQSPLHPAELRLLLSIALPASPV